MKIPTILQKLGLTESEARVYQAVLNLGSETVTTIAKTSGLYRPTVYKALAALEKRNLISRSQLGKRTIYIAENPTALSKLFGNLEEEFKQTLPDLLQHYAKSKNQPAIYFFKGKEGIRRVYTDLVQTVKKGDIIYRYESPKDYKKNKKYYPRLYMEIAGKKLQSSIEKFVITNKNTHSARSKQLERYSKYVPPSINPFEFNITQIIYKNKVAFIDYDAETVSIIESTKFAQFQREIFKLVFSVL
ncbi:helix-turn-helix domain-containing protein [Patescibacteria group bacterium]|nr:helix-turn-helix domain-containing protein [Patescibacteria group bacterium]MBU1951591.1 helix-turn-helix domain-containing protein [Patescibacteria group bacterium]